MKKNQHQERFFDNSENKCDKSDPENPYICILDQNFIVFSSKVIELKLTQNLVTLGINGLKTPVKFGSDPQAPSEVLIPSDQTDRFHM